MPSHQINASKILLPYLISKIISPTLWSSCNTWWFDIYHCFVFQLTMNPSVSCTRPQSSLRAKSISHFFFFNPQYIALSRYSLRSKLLAKDIDHYIFQISVSTISIKHALIPLLNGHLVSSNKALQALEKRRRVSPNLQPQNFTSSGQAGSMISAHQLLLISRLRDVLVPTDYFEHKTKLNIFNFKKIRQNN